MKTIQTSKRLYAVIPRSSPVSSYSSSPPKSANSLRRPRSHSSSFSNTDRKTLYTSAGSNGLPLHYFDSVAPPTPLPSSRPANPHAVSTSRLPQSGESHIQVTQNPHGSHPQQQQGQLLISPISLALTSPPATTSTSISSERHHSLCSSVFFPFQHRSLATPSLSEDQHLKAHSHNKIYQLDVGAYGIPKRCSSNRELPESEHLGLAVQIGEDAYFIRDDAMGVADGVGGWNRVQCGSQRHSDPTDLPSSSDSSAQTSQRACSSKRKSAHPSASALFARSLMHFCSYEIGLASSCRYTPTLEPSMRAKSASILTATFASSLTPRPSPLVFRSTQRQSNVRPFAWPWESDRSIVGLSDRVADTTSGEYARYDEETLRSRHQEPPNNKGGVDPMDILEKAYRKALKMHMKPNHVSGRSVTTAEPSRLPEPLLVGSSTALLAILSGERLRIAHLGDCTGLLVRGGEIVWKSEEMWWAFNHPLQLGPSSPTQPADALTYEIDVLEDDILILASDGMSDNLWEEDILDEVKRFSELHLLRNSSNTAQVHDGVTGLLGRRTLAGMLSEALCSRAKKTSGMTYERSSLAMTSPTDDCAKSLSEAKVANDKYEVPFARRAREEGRFFKGGKNDDISVLVAVISVTESLQK